MKFAVYSIVLLSLMLLILTVTTSYADSVPKSFLAEVWQIHDNKQNIQESASKKAESLTKGTVVILTEDIVIELTLNGRKAGNMTLKTGRKVEVLTDYYNELEIKVGNITSRIPKKSVKSQTEINIVSK